MKIIRWISCHLILLIVLVSVAVGWYFRTDLASDYARLTGQTSGALASSGGIEETESQRQQSVSHEAPTSGISPLDSPTARRAVPGAFQEQARTEHPEATPQSHIPDRQAANARSSMPTDSRAPSGPAVVPDSQEETNTGPGASSVFPGDEPLLQSAPVMNGQETELASTEAMYPPDDYDPEMEKSMAGANERGAQQGSTGPLPGMAGSTPSVPEFPPHIPGNDMTPGDLEPSTRQQEALPGQPDFKATPQQASAAGYQSQLESARRLFWGGDLDAARQEYEKLVMNYPDRPESASELGNLLMQQNLSEEAERAYDSAVANFRRLHRDDEAIGLIRFISRYNPSLADTLYNKYWQ